MTDTCPVCGDPGPHTRSYNGTCSSDCARTKATADAFNALADCIKALANRTGYFLPNYPMTKVEYEAFTGESAEAPTESGHA
jgi:hypothetical protein